jgi:hypothetical protein
MRSLALALVLALALAGCTVFGPGAPPTPTGPTGPTGPTSTTPTGTTPTTPTVTTTPPTPTNGVPANAYNLTLSGLPEIIEVGIAVNLTVNATGDASRFADAIAVRWGSTSVATPNATDYPNACATTSGQLPGAFTVSCTFTVPGTTYLRAYARVNGTEFWSAEATLPTRAPVGSFTVTSPNATADPTGQKDAQLPPAVAGQDYLILLNVTGQGSETAQNVTLHFRDCSNALNGCDADTKVCSRGAGAIPGDYYVVCRFNNPAQYVLEGHVEVVVGPTVHVFTSAPMDLVVGPALPV